MNETALRRGTEALRALLGGPDPNDPDKEPEDACLDALVRLDLADREQLAAAITVITEQLDGIGWEPDPEPGHRWIRA